jgi:crossover junction endodeoxyribonuclease RusA
MAELVVNFFPPAPLLTLNQRMHWAPKSRHVAEWRKAAWAAATNRKRHPSWPDPPLPRSLLKVSLPVKSLLVRRDPHNFVATIKPIIDGLVDAKFWPDDTPEYVVSTDPEFHTSDRQVWVRIYPVEAR